MVDIKDKKEEGIDTEEKQSHKKNKFNEALENIKKNEKIEDIYNYARSNTGDTIAYVAMIVGILTLFFEPFFGGTIIGIVTGLYFSKEIIRPIKNIENFIEKLGMVRSLILGGLLLAFLIKIADTTDPRPPVGGSHQPDVTQTGGWVGGNLTFCHTLNERGCFFHGSISDPGLV